LEIIREFLLNGDIEITESELEKQSDYFRFGLKELGK